MRMTNAEWQELLTDIKDDKITGILKLSFQELNLEDITALAEALKQNNTLTSLNLSRSEIGRVGAGHLAEGLAQNSTLTSLNLSGNEIGCVGAGHLAEGLAHNSTLTSLDLRNNEIGDAGAGHLAEWLAHNSTLTSLNLFCNQIGRVGAGRLAGALKQNSTLTSLNLSGHVCSSQIDDDGAGRLAKGLAHNSTLTSLNLSYNDISDAGAGRLAKGLAHNSTLTSLNLEENQIGDVGAGRLAETLVHNSTLTSLNLQYNQIGDVGARGLGWKLAYNSTLTSLNLQCNQIDKYGEALSRSMNKLSFNKRLPNRCFVYAITTLAQGRRQPLLQVQTEEQNNQQNENYHNSPTEIIGCNYFSDDFMSPDILARILFFVIAGNERHHLCASFIFQWVSNNRDINDSLVPLRAHRFDQEEIFTSFDTRLSARCLKLVKKGYCNTLFQIARTHGWLEEKSLANLWTMQEIDEEKNWYLSIENNYNHSCAFFTGTNLTPTLLFAGTSGLAVASFAAGMLVVELCTAAILPIGFSLVALSAALTMVALLIHCCKSAGLDAGEHSAPEPALAPVTATLA